MGDFGEKLTFLAPQVVTFIISYATFSYNFQFTILGISAKIWHWWCVDLHIFRRFRQKLKNLFKFKTSAETSNFKGFHQKSENFRSTFLIIFFPVLGDEFLQKFPQVLGDRKYKVIWLIQKISPHYSCFAFPLFFNVKKLSPT